MSDLDALVRIERAVFSADRISRRSFRRFLASPACRVLVAELAEKIVGYALLLFRRDSRHARLYSIAADSRSSAKGIGSLLVAAAAAAAMERGAEGVRLEVREDNGRAIALYERSGFRCFGRIVQYYADGATALRYKKSLGNGSA